MSIHDEEWTVETDKATGDHYVDCAHRRVAGPFKDYDTAYLVAMAPDLYRVAQGHQALVETLLEEGMAEIDENGELLLISDEEHDVVFNLDEDAPN